MFRMPLLATASTIVMYTLLAMPIGIAGSTASPIEKVVQMLVDLQAQIIKDGEAVQRVYNDFAEFCEDQSKQLHFDIKTANGEAEQLKAAISDANAKLEELSAKVEDLGSSIADSEGELKEAAEIREKEAENFRAEEKELMSTLDSIQRAHGILQEQAKASGGASFAQTTVQGAQGLVQALAALTNAHAVNTEDADRLTALVQASSEDDDSSLEAPDAAAYEGKTGGIIDTLETLQGKAEEQLSKAREAETSALNNFRKQKLTLTNAVKYATQDMDMTKKDIAVTKEGKAAAEGDLQATSKDLAEDKKSLSALHHDCMTKASDFQQETKSRNEELQALAEAKKVVIEATSFVQLKATVQGGLSFVQVASREVSADVRVAHMVRRLAFAQQSADLARLAVAVESASRHAAKTGEDPFGKIKGLITDMIGRLEDEAAADASKQAYCDKELSDTTAKKKEEEAAIEKITTRMDQRNSEGKKLREEIATLQKELAELQSAQVRLDSLREEENGIYETSRPELERGLTGVKTALKVLRDYYSKDDAAHGSSSGAASSIIGLLEVAESDFSKGLSEMITEEERAVAEYKTETKQNEVTKAAKTEDVQFKSKEVKSLDKASSDFASDLDSMNAQLAAINEYLADVRKQCSAKPVSYADRKAKREAELAGLRDGLEALGGQEASMLLQRGTSRRVLRPVPRATLKP